MPQFIPLLAFREMYINWLSTIKISTKAELFARTLVAYPLFVLFYFSILKLIDNILCIKVPFLTCSFTINWTILTSLYVLSIVLLRNKDDKDKTKLINILLKKRNYFISCRDLKKYYPKFYRSIEYKNMMKSYSHIFTLKTVRYNKKLILGVELICQDVINKNKKEK